LQEFSIAAIRTNIARFSMMIETTLSAREMTQRETGHAAADTKALSGILVSANVRFEIILSRRTESLLKISNCKKIAISHPFRFKARQKNEKQSGED
jgi:hypothetical protein